MFARARVLAQLAARRHLVVTQLATAAEERLGNRAVPLPHSVAQSGPAPPILGVDVRLVLEQYLDDRQVALARGKVQSRAAVVCAASKASVRQPSRGGCQRLFGRDAYNRRR